MDAAFWKSLDEMVALSEVVVDRPKGSAHTRFPDMIYPLDYGYLAGTVAADGGGIDVWLGAAAKAGERDVQGIICAVDLLKRDMEIKILLGCSDDEMQTILEFVNRGDMHCLLVKRTP